jgi:hypothetical protein
MIRITIRHGNRYYRANVHPSWLAKHDNGAVISCGLTVPDDLPMASLRRMVHCGTAREITQVEWAHSACQSYCVTRGDAKCQW